SPEEAQETIAAAKATYMVNRKKRIKLFLKGLSEIAANSALHMPRGAHRLVDQAIGRRIPYKALGLRIKFQFSSQTQGNFPKVHQGTRTVAVGFVQRK